MRVHEKQIEFVKSLNLPFLQWTRIYFRSNYMGVYSTIEAFLLPYNFKFITILFVYYMKLTSSFFFSLFTIFLRKRLKTLQNRPSRMNWISVLAIPFCKGSIYIPININFFFVLRTKTFRFKAVSRWSFLRIPVSRCWTNFSDKWFWIHDNFFSFSIQTSDQNEHQDKGKKQTKTKTKSKSNAKPKWIGVWRNTLFLAEHS